MSTVKSLDTVSTSAADLLPIGGQTKLNELIKIEPRKLPTSDQLPRISAPKKPAKTPGQVNVQVTPNRSVAGGNSATIEYKDPRSGASVTGKFSESTVRPGEATTRTGKVSVELPLLPQAKITGSYDFPTRAGTVGATVEFGDGGSASVSLPANKTPTYTVKSPKVKLGQTPVQISGSNTPATGKTTAGVNVGDNSIGVTTQPGTATSVTGSVQVGSVSGKPITVEGNWTPASGEWKVEVKPITIEF
jgi:hypothetical protein